MAHRDLVVPKFGNWDDGGNVQYTAYFERAREWKSDSEAVRSNTRAKGHYLPKEFDRSAYNSRGLGAAASFKPRTSGECARKSNAGATGFVAATGTSQQHNDGPQLRRHQGGVTGKTRRQFSSDVSDYNMATRTPERLRLKPVLRGEESPSHGNSVPKFGDWDEGNPSAGEGYTEIFNRVIDHKQSEGTDIAPTKTVKGLSSSHKNAHENRSFGVCCCFPRRRKGVE